MAPVGTGAAMKKMRDLQMFALSLLVGILVVPWAGNLIIVYWTWVREPFK